MKTGFCALLIAATLWAAPDPKAEQIAKTMMQAMGGQEAWNKAHFVRFDFIVTLRGNQMITRSHLWDKRAGRYRLEDKSENGSQAVVLFTNIAKQQGTAYVSGKKLEGAAAANALKRSYQTFQNDALWLAMPWMWLEAGTHLKYAGQKTVGGKTFDLVEVSFDHWGNAPGDKYTAYVSTQTHLMETWDYAPVSGSPRQWDWKYTTAAGVMLGSDHTSGAQTSISMGQVQVLDKVDEAVFTNPASALGQNIAK